MKVLLKRIHLIRNTIGFCSQTFKLGLSIKSLHHNMVAGLLGLIDIREFKIQQRDDSKNLKKKSIGLISETITLLMHHFFLYISLLFLYDVKLSNFTFYGEHKQLGNFMSISELGYGPLEFHFRSVCLHLIKYKCMCKE